MEPHVNDSYLIMQLVFPFTPKLLELCSEEYMKCWWQLSPQVANLSRLFSEIPKEGVCQKKK
jgi:hypothetical protein